MKRTAAALLALVLLAVPFSGMARQSAFEQAGTDVSGFLSTDLYGNEFDGSIFSEFEASVVCYFATWSPDCIDQLAILQTIKDENPEYGVFGLLREDATSTVDEAIAVMEGEGYDFPVLLCDDIWQEVVGESVYIPQSFIVSASGIIVEVWHAAFQSATILKQRLMFWSASFVAADGDADENGVVDINDALLVLRCAMGLIVPTQGNIDHGDVNCSGSLDTEDALKILRIALGLA